MNGEVFIAEGSNHVPIPLAGELRDQFNGYFKNVALATGNAEQMISVDEKRFSRQGMYVEPGFLDIFTFNILTGTDKSFNDPNSILIDKSLAVSLFGTENPVGKTLQLSNTTACKSGRSI